MSEVDIKNTLEQMWRAGFVEGFQLGRSATSDRLPNVRFEWKGRQPVIHIERERATGGGLWVPK